MLQNNIDFSVWYDPDEMGSNLVVVEAKRQGGIIDTDSQVLVYMYR
jgi:hypothetical protein